MFRGHAVRFDHLGGHGFGGKLCQQAVQMALHIVDVQDLQLTVIQLQGDKVHVEGLADVRKDLVQHRRLPYILPAMTAQQEGRV